MSEAFGAIPAGGEAAEAPASASLTFRSPEGAWRVLPLPASGSVTIGRRDEADISLPWDPEVSRLHAELSLRETASELRSFLDALEAEPGRLEQVESELELLAQLFGFEVLPLADRRAELALLALRSGLVS